MRIPCCFRADGFHPTPVGDHCILGLVHKPLMCGDLLSPPSFLLRQNRNFGPGQNVTNVTNVTFFSKIAAAAQSRNLVAECEFERK